MENCNAFHAKVYWTQVRSVTSLVIGIPTKSEHVAPMKHVFYTPGKSRQQKLVRISIKI